MMKLVFVICVTVALMQHTEAFKVVTIQKVLPPAPAVDPAALLQGVQTAIAGKLNLVQTLVGALIQQKTALKQNALNSLQSTLGGVQSQFGYIKPGFVVRKHIYVGVLNPAAPVAPDSTTSVDVDATTTSE